MMNRKVIIVDSCFNCPIAEVVSDSKFECGEKDYAPGKYLFPRLCPLQNLSDVVKEIENL